MIGWTGARCLPGPGAGQLMRRVWSSRTSAVHAVLGLAAAPCRTVLADSGPDRPHRPVGGHVVRRHRPGDDPRSQGAPAARSRDATGRAARGRGRWGGRWGAHRDGHRGGHWDGHWGRGRWRRRWKLGRPAGAGPGSVTALNRAPARARTDHEPGARGGRAPQRARPTGPLRPAAPNAPRRGRPVRARRRRPTAEPGRRLPCPSPGAASAGTSRPACPRRGL